MQKYFYLTTKRERERELMVTHSHNNTLPVLTLSHVGKDFFKLEKAL